MDAEGSLVEGDPVAVLVDISDHLDLLVMGSRGYGPLHAVLVGGVSGRVAREAACPLLLVPRGTGDTQLQGAQTAPSEQRAGA